MYCEMWNPVPWSAGKLPTTLHMLGSPPKLLESISTMGRIFLRASVESKSANHKADYVGCVHGTDCISPKSLYCTQRNFDASAF